MISMTDRVEIGDFTLDLRGGKLSKRGDAVEIGGRALAVLMALAAVDGTQSKDALLAAAWPGVTVEEGNLSVQIATLRKLLGDAAIITVPRVGYRLQRSAIAESRALPRLAVLPFEPLGGGSEDAYFADGLAEDLITALGRFRQFGVLSRKAAVAARSTFAEASVDYLLDGSIRRAGTRLVIVAHVSEIRSGRELWSRRMEGDLDDLFEFQDRIATAVATSVAPEIEAAEIAGAVRERTTSMSAYDLYLRALPEIYSESEPSNLRARELLDRALAIEPDNPLYLAHAGWVLEHRSAMGWPLFDADHRDRCIRYSKKALALARGDARALMHAAISLLHMREYDLAVAGVERAERDNPNNLMVLLGAAVMHLHVGKLEAIPSLIGRLEAIDPNDPLRHIHSSLMAAYHLLSGEPEAAAMRAAEGLVRQPHFDPLYWMIVAAEVALGRMVEARRHVTELRVISPQATVASIRAGQPSKLPDRIEPILAALAVAGLPEF
jgi:TolB-like protein